MTHPHDRVAQAIGIRARDGGLAGRLQRIQRRPRHPLTVVLLVVPLLGPLVTLLRLGAIETAALRACALGFGPLFVTVPMTVLAA